MRLALYLIGLYLSLLAAFPTYGITIPPWIDTHPVARPPSPFALVAPLSRAEMFKTAQSRLPPENWIEFAPRHKTREATMKAQPIPIITTQQSGPQSRARPRRNVTTGNGVPPIFVVPPWPEWVRPRGTPPTQADPPPFNATPAAVPLPGAIWGYLTLLLLTARAGARRARI